ncbi:glycosyltransferase family 9 protein [Symbiopectobacterium sp.]|uniref:glycosyltransferase family 9 protein n=1 Tax=Symbiopectobacterium sp. TaxID=2952789 RepID=UPI003F6880D3
MNIMFIMHIFSQKIKLKNENIIIFNPFSSQKNRNLSTNKINIILTYLNTLVGYKTIVFNFGNEINHRLMKRIEINPFEDAERSFALVQYADIVITVDTAVIHFASALNKRQFCIYNNRMFNSVFDKI